MLTCAFLLTILVLALPVLSPAFADDETSANAAEATNTATTVRVGFPLSPGLNDISASGAPGGYTYDFLQEIAQFAGWSYEYTFYEGTQEEQSAAAVADLKAGNIDLLGGMDPNSDSGLLFPQNSYGSSYSVLYTPPGATATRSNLHSFSPLRVACDASDTRVQNDLELYAQSCGLNVQLVPLDDGLEQAVAVGRADICLSVDLALPADCTVIMRISPRPMFFAVSPGNSKLVSQLDSALAHIYESEPSFAEDTYTEYFFTQSTTIELNQKERACVASQRVLRAGFLADRAPMSYADDQGNAVGASVDALRSVSEATGLNFEYIMLDASTPIADQIESLNLDIVAGLDRNPIIAQELNVSQSVAYSTPRITVVFNGDKSYSDLSADSVIAVTPERENAYREQGYNVRSYDTVADCLAAVNRGEVEYTFESAYLTTYYQSIGEYDNLKTADASVQHSSTCFSLVRPINPELLSVFNKCIQQISRRDMTSMVYSHSFPTEDFDLRSFITHHPLVFASIVTVPAAVVIAAFGVIAYTRTRASRRDALTGLYTSAHFERKCARSLAGAIPGTAFLLLIDVDDFKSVNDRFGHHAGDLVLKALSGEIHASCGKGEYGGRLGGDEFLVFWHGKSEREVIDRAETLLTKITDAVERSSSIPVPLTASIGITQLSPSGSYEEAYCRADEELYRAKRSTKNTVAYAGSDHEES